MMTFMKRQESFGQPFEMASDYNRGGTFTTAASEKVAPDNFHEKTRGTSYLKNLFKRWMDMYKTAIDNKSCFLKVYKNEFYTTFI
jgi:hypothetical protein